MSTVIDIDSGWEEFKRGIAELEPSSVKVGIFKDEDPEIAVYAVINEFGAQIDGGDIPERAFFRSAIDANIDRYTDEMCLIVAEVIEGKISPKRGWQLLGEEAKDDIERSIETWSTPPNERSTVTTKAREGGGNAPLIDSGAMLGSIKVRVS